MKCSPFGWLQCVGAKVLPVSVLIGLVGCNNGPSRVKPPKINASRAAAEAMTLYDGNGDGFIADDELDAAASLKASMSTLDTNGDKKVDSDEIAARIEAWQESKAGVTRVQCRVMKKGRPVVGAIVTFEPEPFLGSQMRTATDETDFEGNASPSIAKEERLTPDAPRGLQLGFFRVKISKMENGRETVPAKFNTATTLGQQISPDDPAVENRRIRFNL